MRRSTMTIAATLFMAIGAAACETPVAIAGIGGGVTQLSVSTDPPLASGAQVTITVGGTVRLAATGLNALGLPVGSVSATWTSESPDVATVSEDGEVTGVAPGSARVVARSDGVRGTLTVTVAEPPDGS